MERRGSRGAESRGRHLCCPVFGPLHHPTKRRHRNTSWDTLAWDTASLTAGDDGDHPILVVVDLTSHLLLGRRLSAVRTSTVFTKRLGVPVMGRRFIRMRKGFISLANGRVGCGDYIALLAGGRYHLSFEIPGSGKAARSSGS